MINREALNADELKILEELEAKGYERVRLDYDTYQRPGKVHVRDLYLKDEEEKILHAEREAESKKRDLQFDAQYRLQNDGNRIQLAIVLILTITLVVSLFAYFAPRTDSELEERVERLESRIQRSEALISRFTGYNFPKSASERLRELTDEELEELYQKLKKAKEDSLSGAP